MSKPPQSSSVVSFLGTWLIDRVNVFFKIRRYIKMIAERWMIVAAFTLLGTGIAIYMALHSPDIFQSYATLQVQPKVVPGGGRTLAASYLVEANGFYESQLILARTTARNKARELVVTEGGFPASVSPTKMDANKAPNAALITLTVESTNLDFSRKFARLWATSFLETADEQKNYEVKNKINGINQKLAIKETEIAVKQGDIEKLKKENGGITIDSLNMAEKNIQTLKDELKKTEDKRQQLEKTTGMEDLFATLQLLQNGSAAGQNQNGRPNGANGASRDVLQAKGFQEHFRAHRMLVDDYNQYTNTLQSTHPFMLELEKKVALSKRELEYDYTDLKAEQEALISQYKLAEKTLAQQILEDQATWAKNRGLQVKLETLTGELTQARDIRDDLSRQIASLGMGAENEANFAIQEADGGGSAAVAPRRSRMIMIGFLVGLGFGLATIYMLGRLDDRLELAEEIEAELEEPVLGQIPEVDPKHMLGDSVLITRIEEHNMFSEALRGVRSAVMLGAQGKTRQVLIVSSAVPGDGKTTFTVNFAITLAIAGHRVLLVDADLRRGKVNSYFGGERAPGFSEILLGQMHWSDVMHQTEVKTLHTIYSGAFPSNPGELLISAVTREFLAEVRKEYDYILFDCPPLTAIDDTFSLASLADGLLFVVRSGRTSMRFANNALTTVRQRGADILGIVLNGIRSDNPYYYYKNYYYNYYSQEAASKKTKIHNAPLPGSKMAVPKGRRQEGARSIAEEARAFAQKGDGQTASIETVSSGLDQFKARSSVRRPKGIDEVSKPEEAPKSAS